MAWKLFREKPIHVGPLQTDWKVGDFALCIYKGRWYPFNVGPKEGHIALVTKVEYCTSIDKVYKGFALTLLGPWDCSWEVTRFRKVKSSDLKSDPIRSRGLPIDHLETVEE